MVREVHLSVRIALLQTFAVIVGVLMTRTAFMAAGYPESDLAWNSIALLIRNHGNMILLIPVAWTMGVTYVERHPPGWWSRRWTAATGMLVLAAMAILFVWSTFNPHQSNSMPLKRLSD